MYYLWRPYASLDGYILISAAIYYFRRLHITFDGNILLLALPDCYFVRIQDFITISYTYGLKARLKSSVLLKILKCWKFEFCLNLNFVLLVLQMVRKASK